MTMTILFSLKNRGAIFTINRLERIILNDPVNPISPKGLPFLSHIKQVQYVAGYLAPLLTAPLRTGFP
jgi:hypothetical protein